MARSNEPIAEPQMTAAEFAAALKQHGFRVVRAKIEDEGPGAKRGSNRTLAKVIRERDAEIARLAPRETEPD